jgi:hypothetical protein
MTMNYGQAPEASERTRQSLTVVAGGSFAQAAAAGAAAVMAIIGLAGTLTYYMMSIGTIALGAAFLLQGGSVASQQFRLVSQARGDDIAGPVRGASVSAAAIAGMAGVALGILALLDVAPAVLVPAAIITFSGALFLSSGSVDRVTMSYQQRIDSFEPMTGASAVGGGGDQLVGIGGAALGILALIGFATVTLSLVGLLALGASVFLSGSAIGTKIMSFR